VARRAEIIAPAASAPAGVGRSGVSTALALASSGPACAIRQCRTYLISPNSLDIRMMRPHNARGRLCWTEAEEVTGLAAGLEPNGEPEIAGRRWRDATAELEYAERHGAAAAEVERLADEVIEARVAMFQAGVSSGWQLPEFLQAALERDRRLLQIWNPDPVGARSPRPPASESAPAESSPPADAAPAADQWPANPRSTAAPSEPDESSPSSDQ
jgi:hypothetical protein